VLIRLDAATPVASVWVFISAEGLPKRTAALWKSAARWVAGRESFCGCRDPAWHKPVRVKGMRISWANSARVTGPLMLVGILAACGGLEGDAGQPREDPLPSWKSGAVKDAILDFVGRVTDPENADFVAPADRVAVFDNDGTLIAERPEAVQFAFIYDRIRKMAGAHPEWSTTQPFQAVLEDDPERLRDLSFADLRALGAAAQADMTHEEFEQIATAFISVAEHPRYETPWVEVVYRPMLQLVNFLQAEQFRVFLVSGGNIEFIRSYAEEYYGVPKENVIGSSRKLDWREVDDRTVIYRKTGINSVNARQFKPLNIQLHTGRRPILAVGNSDGDLEMMRFTDDSLKPSLVLLLQHDDAEREYDYSDGAEEVRRVATEKGWQTVSIRNDFNDLFPGEAMP
jgi:phosphoserine phosphatase